MKPPKFDYHAPPTLDEALALLVRYDGDAKVLAGGQSLVPLLNFRLARPAALIDLNRIKSLAYIREDDGRLRFGAMTRQRAIEFSPIVARRLPQIEQRHEALAPGEHFGVAVVAHEQRERLVQRGWGVIVELRRLHLL